MTPVPPSKISQAAQTIIEAGETTNEGFPKIIGGFAMITEISGKIKEASPMINAGNLIISEAA